MQRICIELSVQFKPAALFGLQYLLLLRGLEPDLEQQEGRQQRQKRRGKACPRLCLPLHRSGDHLGDEDGHEDAVRDMGEVHPQGEPLHSPQLLLINIFPFLRSAHFPASVYRPVLCIQGLFSYCSGSSFPFQ